MYLLPGTVSFTLEQRENLIVNPSPDGNVVAWRTVDSDRQAAYCLDATLDVLRPADWQQVVFIDAAPHAVGLVVDDVQLLPNAETPIVPFIPLGPKSSSNGHLFSGAWVSGHRVTLVFEPGVLTAYLQSLGEER